MKKDIIHSFWVIFILNNNQILIRGPRLSQKNIGVEKIFFFEYLFPLLNNDQCLVSIEIKIVCYHKQFQRFGNTFIRIY